jgi:ParB/RepB/Spo0J family partition protein
MGREESSPTKIPRYTRGGSHRVAQQPHASGFDQSSLRELAASFKPQGVLAPLLVRDLDESNYEVIAGARRLRAAKHAELESVPVRIVKLSNAEAIEAQCVELSVVGKSFLC